MWPNCSENYKQIGRKCSKTSEMWLKIYSPNYNKKAEKAFWKGINASQNAEKPVKMWPKLQLTR